MLIMKFVQCEEMHKVMVVCGTTQRILFSKV